MELVASGSSRFADVHLSSLKSYTFHAISSAAWKASSYLNSLLTASQITFEPSASLDAAYKPSSGPADLLLTLDTVPKLVKAFKLNEDEAGELRRAVVQAKARLAQGASMDEPPKVGEVVTEKSKDKAQ